jgi:hypothetical protein
VQAGFGLEIVEVAKTSGKVVHPGEALSASECWSLVLGMWTLFMATGQSLSTGTQGIEFVYATIYNIIMFAQVT